MKTANSSTDIHRSDAVVGTVFDFIHRLTMDRFFGRVELSFQSGNVVNIRQEQNFKPSDLSKPVANSKGTAHVNSAQ